MNHHREVHWKWITMKLRWHLQEERWKQDLVFWNFRCLASWNYASRTNELFCYAFLHVDYSITSSWCAVLIEGADCDNLQITPVVVCTIVSCFWHHYTGFSVLTERQTPSAKSYVPSGMIVILSYRHAKVFGNRWHWLRGSFLLVIYHDDTILMQCTALGPSEVNFDAQYDHSIPRAKLLLLLQR